MPQEKLLQNKIQKLVACALSLVLVMMQFGIQPVFSQSKTELEQELQNIERQIAEYEKELASTQSEKQSLSLKLKQLKNEQNRIMLQMRSTTLRVNQLNEELGKTEGAIIDAGDQIESLTTQTSNLVTELYINSEASAFEIFLDSDNLSEAILDLVSMERLTDQVATKSQQLTQAKIELEEKQELLEEQQGEAKNLLALQSLQQAEYQQKVAEQNQVLEVTKGQEAQYQAVLAQSRRRASEIRARLYELAGGGSTQVTFGQAVEIANWTSQQTGVRTAFLLAILTQESNLGKNVGTCNRAGDPEEKSWRNVMHPKRDAPLFPEITNELGMDVETTPVSCPMKRNGRQIGWGGAMGPAQFIPSTWRGYKDKVAAITGRPANPWDINDAFLAAGLLLKGRGATQDGRQGEWNAAMRYFSGGTNPAFRFYGDNVLKLADRYQAEIDALQ